MTTEELRLEIEKIESGIDAHSEALTECDNQIVEIEAVHSTFQAQAKYHKKMRDALEAQKQYLESQIFCGEKYPKSFFDT